MIATTDTTHQTDPFAEALMEQARLEARDLNRERMGWRRARGLEPDGAQERLLERMIDDADELCGHVFALGITVSPE